MSRIGKNPVAVPAGVTVSVKGSTVSAKGPKGELLRSFHPEMAIKLEGTTLSVDRPSDEARHKALHGLSRTLLSNMVEGVAKGYRQSLEMQGTGYKAEAKPFGLVITAGYSHQVKYEAPKGIKLSVDNSTIVKIEGADKELVGQVAAEIRAIRPPEPYKGKGIRYLGEQVRRKAGKTGAK